MHDLSNIFPVKHCFHKVFQTPDSLLPLQVLTGILQRFSYFH